MFQQEGSGEAKIRALAEHGRDLAVVRVVNIDGPLPPVLDRPEALLPEDLEADLVLDHLRHPDLTHALALLCQVRGIPVIASGRRVPVPGLLSPPTCCGLAESSCPGPYGQQFGLPAYEVTLDKTGCVEDVLVLRGAPCGATWDAVPELLGRQPSDALTKVGLFAQIFCKARPAAWDPIWGKSPVHFAGHVHAKALRRALHNAGVPTEGLPVDPELSEE